MSSDVPTPWQGDYESTWQDFWLLKLRCEVLLTPRPMTLTFTSNHTLGNFELSQHCEMAVLVQEMRNIASSLATTTLSEHDQGNPAPHITWLPL